MKKDYQQHPATYRPITLEGKGGKKQKADPKDKFFYRAYPWVQQFFKNTDRYENLLERKQEKIGD
jgi:hypothetical protein